MGAPGTIPPPGIDKVLKLFTGPNSDKLYDRHMSALERLCKSNAAGFAIKDLPQIQQLFELTLGLIGNGMSDFIQPAVALLKTLSKPFVKQTSTDEFRLIGNVTDMLRSISKALLAGCPVPIQLAASEMLLVFASGYGTRPSALVVLPSLEELSTGSPLRQYLFNQKLLVDSGVVQHVVSGLAMATLAHDEVLMMSLTLTLNQMSYHPDNVNLLLQAGIMQCMPTLLGFEYTHPIITVAVELLWNMLERAPRATRAILVAAQPALSQIISGVTCMDVAAAAAAAASAPAETQPAAEPSPTDEPSTISDSAPDQVSGSSEAGELTIQTDNLNEAVASTTEANEASAPAPETEPSSAQRVGEESLTSPSGGAALKTRVEGCVLPALAEALTQLFRAVLLQGYRAVDKELRNDILVTINLIMGTEHIDLPPAGHHPRHSCGAIFCSVAAAAGLFEPLLAVSTSPELGAHEHPDQVKAWALTTEESDLELKLLAWRACTAGCVHTGPRGAVLPLAKAWGLARVLLACAELVPDAAQPAVAAAAFAAHKRWAGDPITQLRVAALSRLYSLAPMCPEAYLAEGGTAVVLRLLSMGAHTESVEAALRHLHQFVACVPEMAEVLGESGGLRTLLDVLQDPGRSQSSRHYCMLLLASVCRVNVENLRRLRHEGGVLALLGQLARCKAMDPTLPSAYTVAALDAVWACVVADRKNAAKFLVEDGMDALLDLLEVSNRGHRAVILSLLCDLLENPRSHPFFQAWKSGRDARTSAQLLLSVWRDEEAARGMTQGGMLVNVTQPLAGTGKRTQWVPQESLVYSGLASLPEPGQLQASLARQGGDGDGPGEGEGLKLDRATTVAAMLEASTGERVFAKVYGIFRLLGFGSFGSLAPSDAATLALVEMFVKFKQGELWARLRDEFEAEGLRPTAPDRDRVESGIELCEHLGRTLRDTQGALKDRELKAAAEQEAMFYNNIRAQRKLEQEARFYKKDKSQLTMAEVREAKQKKETMLRASLIQPDIMA